MYKRLKTTSILAGTAMALTISGCSNYTPWSGGKKMLGDVPEATSTSLSVGVTDLLGAPISGAQIKVFEPLGQNLIKDSLQTQVSDDGGFVYFKLSDISAAVKIAVETDAENYMASGRTVTIEPGAGNSAVFKLVADSTASADVQERQKAAGITVASAKEDATSGKLDKPIVATTEAVADSNSPTTVLLKPTKVEIPTSATILDANGEPLNGELRLTVARYDSANDTALANFPGGLSGVILSAENPNDLPSASDDQTGESDGAVTNSNSVANGGAVFQSAGFVAVELVEIIKDEDGNETQGRVARTLSDSEDQKPVTITMPIAAGTDGPDGSPIEVGDEVPVWSFNTDEGTWKSEGVGKATSDGAGGLEVNFQVNHFSYWNLDFLYGSCTANLTMQSENGTSYTNGLDLEMKRDSVGGWIAENHYRGDGFMTVFNAPSAYKVGLTAKTKSGEVVSIKTVNGKAYEPFNLCSNGGAHTVVFADAKVKDVPMTVNYSNICADSTDSKPMSNIDTFVGFYDPSNPYEWLGDIVRTDAAGNATYNVPEGADVYTYFYDSRNGSWKWSDKDREKPFAVGAGGNSYDVETVVPCEDVIISDPTGGTGGTGSTN